MNKQYDMETAVKNKIEKWLEGNYDEATKAEINKLLNEKKEEELTDAFYKDLEFGTGGLRGLMGVGSNRMNKYTVGAATQGLANYLLQNFPGQNISVAIAHDSRNNSAYFAQVVADIFSANNIKVYLFEALRPTPELSFAIRELGCKSGVVLTASHNPKEYNGYKAYWEDGSQVIAPHDTNIIKEVDKITTVEAIKFKANKDLIVKIGEDIDNKYLDAITSLSVSPEVIQRQKDLKIVFSPIHGTGITLVPAMLKKFGFENVHVVEAQATPDGNFPTVVYPNPEEADAMKIAVEKAKEIDADLVLATDPDADRVGIAVKNHHGEWQLLNGNQTGSLLINYMLNAWKEKGKLDGKQFVCKTIVTSELIDTMCKAFKVDCYNVLTGFKFIAGIIRELEGKKKFIAGGEESYGYLIGDDVRDKDAVASCAFIAELVAYAKDKGKTVFEWLMDLYMEYGFYKETLISLTKKGKSGAEEIQQMMEDFRAKPPKTIAGSTTLLVKDYQLQKETNLVTGEVKSIDLPKSNVIQLITEDGSKISARPSGTEPKIKFYFGVKTALNNKADFDKVSKSLDDKIDLIIKELQLV